MELSWFIVSLQRPSCISDLWLLGYRSTEQQDGFDLCYQSSKDSFPLIPFSVTFFCTYFPSSAIVFKIIPESEQINCLPLWYLRINELKKGQPDQSKNALDKRSAPSPRGIVTRSNLSVLSIYLWLINHLKIWYLEIIFFLWFIILSTLLFLAVYFVKIVISGLKLTFFPAYMGCLGKRTLSSNLSVANRLELSLLWIIPTFPFLFFFSCHTLLFSVLGLGFFCLCFPQR